VSDLGLTSATVSVHNLRCLLCGTAVKKPLCGHCSTANTVVVIPITPANEISTPNGCFIYSDS
jgi:hypothetical protein